ncbi:hypothetical protein [Alkalibacillus almallahensis]|uniref:hypothetical protein n=1 Tax=Alkalibacillus almallahensis TaxID=1379154 RepID=UPI0014209700|nr:hypothetical protein [Alkalibacillus almallahensis]NIK13467.1 hypothetical protein [Alkalibacillus almallahensis]
MKRIAGIGIVLLGFVLGACSPSMDEAFDEAENKVKETFLSSNTKETNTNFDQFDIYKPEELEVSDQNKSNVVFKEDDQSYVLFVNEFEAPNSKWFYNQIENKGLYLKTFETEDAFAYLQAKEYDEERYEIHVGIGGIKMSTVTNVGDMEEDITMMIEMIESVKQQ